MLNKQAKNEEAGFEGERDKIQPPDTNIVKMTEESLNFWLTKFVEKIWKGMGKSIRQKFVMAHISMKMIRITSDL